MAIVNWTNISDFAQLPAQANVATDGTFWVGMLYMIWAVLILLMIYFGFEIALTVASFLALIIGLFLVYAGLVSWQYLMVFVGILLAMFIYIIWSGQK
jgi:hypothetical protein